MHACRKGTNDLAFAPDGKLVYAGGTEGCVHVMEAATGRVRDHWFATPTGKEEYGHRISTVNVSPDGRFAAAGTGPEGLVFLFSTAKGDLLRVLPHGGSTILAASFSPDSSRLATLAAGRLKIWRIPDVKKECPSGKRA